MVYRSEHKVVHLNVIQKPVNKYKNNAESLPAVFAEDWAACSFSVGFGSTGPAGDPSLSLPDVEQYWTCVHVKDATLESGKLNQSLCIPPPLFQPTENHKLHNQNNFWI